MRARFGFRHRGLLGALVLAPVGAAAMLSRPLVREDGWPGLTLNTLGWVCFLLYACVRTWATLFIGGHKDRALQTEGPYSLCRNPLYFGSFCYALSMACFIKSLTFAVALLLLAAVYARYVVRAEEHFLARRFGVEFLNYCRRIPRFWPRGKSFHSPDLVSVELRRLKQECIRIGCATLLPLVLQWVLVWRHQPAWPHWINLI